VVEQPQEKPQEKEKDAEIQRSAEQKEAKTQRVAEERNVAMQQKVQFGMSHTPSPSLLPSLVSTPYIAMGLLVVGHACGYSFLVHPYYTTLKIGCWGTCTLLLVTTCAWSNHVIILRRDEDARCPH